MVVGVWASWVWTSQAVPRGPLVGSGAISARQVKSSVGMSTVWRTSPSASRRSSWPWPLRTVTSSSAGPVTVSPIIASPAWTSRAGLARAPWVRT